MFVRFTLAVSVLAMAAACGPEQAPEILPAGETPAPMAAPEFAADEIPAPDGEIAVTAPLAGARVSSPLVVEGAANNSWMFEGVLNAEIEVDGQAIAQRPGEQQAPDNWTHPGPVRFKAELPFTVTADTPAVLVLQESMPRPANPDSDEDGPARTLRIPVVLVPGR